MSTKHLSIGSVDPPRTEGVLRVYSMKFCPFAQRAILVLKAKNIPHEVVNINLFKKPEWYSKIHEKTLVPALVDGDKTVVESLDIANYLDEKYPENPLYPLDPEAKKKDKEVITKSSAALGIFARCVFVGEEHTPEEWAKLFLEALQPLEEELAKRGTPFFGGEKPGMISGCWLPEKQLKTSITSGSVDPPRTEGLLRLYSLKCCLYAQRVTLVLKAKKIPHEIVYIDVSRKPDWYSKINLKGEVPTLVDGSKVIAESLDIVDYLDEKYPENPLYPSDSEAKKRDKELIQKARPAQRLFSNCCYTNEQKTAEEWTKLFLEALKPLEYELIKRDTAFFGGNSPGMVDYMIWPWAERAGCISLKLGQKLPLKKSDIPFLRKWRKIMLEQPVCSELYFSGERFWKIVQYFLSGSKVVPYDEL